MVEELISSPTPRGMVLPRLSTLATGHAGVRVETAERLAAMLSPENNTTVELVGSGAVLAAAEPVIGALS